jgi:DNA processing protein
VTSSCRRAIRIGEADYPARLREAPRPPKVLWAHGDLALLDRPCVAVVGTRRATAYGERVARELGRVLAIAGATVVSGLVRGVDACAHRGALEAQGATAAVLGTGLDVVYPRAHHALQRTIAERGLLLSELDPGDAAHGGSFPERNRIIAGLAEAVVVVEADERSGALITARLALEEGREVMAVPGSVFSRLSAGPNGLLRAGATPVLTAADVLSTLGLPPLRSAAAEDEHPLLQLIPAGEAVTVDRLAAASRQPVAQVLEALLALELAGRVVRQADGSYRRSHASPST